jgi:hypothetical protein
MIDFSTVSGLPATVLDRVSAIRAAVNSGDAEAAGGAVRNAFDLCRSHPAVSELAALARKVIDTCHPREVSAFPLVAGGTYPRTGEQLYAERAVRSAIQQALASGVSPAEINPASVARAFPDQIAQVRAEVGLMMSIAAAVLHPSIDVASLAEKGDPLPKDAEKLFASLTQPTTYGSYDKVREWRTSEGARARKEGRPDFLAGFQADHLIRDQYVRTGKRASDADVTTQGFCTLLHDGQTEGTQHRFASDMQKAFLWDCRASGKVPTYRLYFEAAEKWMAEIYARGDMFVDWVQEVPPSPSRAHVESQGERNFGLQQGSLMRRGERRQIALAAAKVLIYKAIRHTLRNGVAIDNKLPGC